MPDKFDRPTDPANALYHDTLCGNVERVKQAVRDEPHLIRGKPVVTGAWSHGGRRCGAEEHVIECLTLLVKAGADYSELGSGTLDSAFKAFPRAARLLFRHGARTAHAGRDGTTVLHAMAAIGNRSAAKFLLDQGAQINAQTVDGATPLDIAISHNLPRMVQFLMARGATSSDIQETVDPFDEHATHCCGELGDGRISGEVAWYRADRGYGYLRDHGQSEQGVYGDLFFDRDSIIGIEPDAVEEETALGFEITHDAFGLRASHVDFGLLDNTVQR